jgi:hypothetical protein
MTEDEKHVPKPRPEDGPERPYYYVVGGSGSFPDDMLRYDLAWAITQTNYLEENGRPMVLQGPRSVIIASWLPDLTNGRWSSFGWGLVEELGEGHWCRTSSRLLRTRVFKGR